VATAYSFDGDGFAVLDWQADKALRWAAWRPDDAFAILVGNGGTTLLFDGGRTSAMHTGTRHNLRGVAWSPDGKMALLVGNRGAVVVLEGESFRELSPVSGENLRRVAWHPGSGHALIVGNAGTVLRYDRRDGALYALPGDRAHTLRSIAYHPDGSYALVGAYASRWAGYPRPHALYRCDGRFLQALLASDEEDDLLAAGWSDDGVALIAGYATSEAGRRRNKALLYDGADWRSRSWEGKGLVLGGGWQPGTKTALLVGENGYAARITESGGIEELETGTNDNLIGPFWTNSGRTALILKGPGDRVYTV
jgi:hypothetical protein